MAGNRLAFVVRWVSAFLDVRRLIAVLYLPRYVQDWIRFSRKSRQRLSFVESFPCLSDRVATTPFDPHYLYQAAWLGRCLAQRPPKGQHVDVGSDVRLMVVLSAFVETRFIDYRPLAVALSGLECIAGDITALSIPDASIDSLSCLHVVEHVGLGRYGDPIDPDGSLTALRELARVLAPGGMLYLSVPVGRERVCYNAHRVYAPESISEALRPLLLFSFSLVTDQHEFISDAELSLANQQEYGCGMFVFTR